jgi:hypothetical protein
MLEISQLEITQKRNELFLRNTIHGTLNREAAKCVNGGAGLLTRIRSGESRSAQSVGAQSNISERICDLPGDPTLALDD